MVNVMASGQGAAVGVAQAIAQGAAGNILSFTGMTDLGIGGGFDLQFDLRDKSATVTLLVGTTNNRVAITGTTPRSRRDSVLAAIDTNGRWGEEIDLWMVAEKNGVTLATTNPVKYKSHVKPYYGSLKISDIAKDDPAMKYPGNGKGRLLSSLINNRYYFIYAGKHETDNAMRGFDCTSFPMALLSIPRLNPPGYGKQVCDALNAEKCNLEQVKSDALATKFKLDSIPVGLYVLFSEGHVLLYNSDINTLYEFTYGGFKATLASLRVMSAPRNLWWMRKINESYRPNFS